MFFLLRSTLCIGLVVAALPDNGPSLDHGRSPATTAAARPSAGALAGSLARTGAEKLCRAAPGRCLALVGEGLKAGAPQAFALLANPSRRAVSRDTLSATDRRPGWNGPPVADD